MSSRFLPMLLRAGLTAGLLALALPATPARAQNFFEALFGAFTGDSSARSYGPVNRDDRFPASGRESGGERRAGEARLAGGQTNCVRLCDGRHFPVPRAVNGISLDSAKVCSALCPAARTQVFHGGNLEYARAADGTRYTDLENAFVYRDRVVPDCSCTGHGPGGLAQIDVESDPTLRAGDVVATSAGLTVFKGAGSFPYKAADFTPIDNYARVNADLRRKLADVKVDATAVPSTPAQSLAGIAEERPIAKPRRRAPVRAARTEESGRSFFDGWFR